MTSQSHNSGTIVSYTWDAANNLTRLTWPDGFDVDYEWDANNRVTAAKDGTRVLASVAYDALSRRSSVSYDNGSSASYTYTDRGDLTDHDLAGDLRPDFQLAAAPRAKARKPKTAEHNIFPSASSMRGVAH